MSLDIIFTNSFKAHTPCMIGHKLKEDHYKPFWEEFSKIKCLCETP